MSTFFSVAQHASGRVGQLNLMNGVVQTPYFMPIATKGAVKTLSVADLETLGAEMILSNTYHQFLRPGVELIRQAGSLQKFMGWQRPILTDSGGFQIFSLGRRTGSGNLAAPKVTEDGVEFQSPLDGAKHFLTPEQVVQIQLDLGSDIIMVLDHLVGYPATREQAQVAMERSVRWAKRALVYFQEKMSVIGDAPRPLLFAIIQGGTYDDLRIQCAQQLTALDFDGFAIGGLAVGEPEEEMYRVLDVVVPHLPANKPRYLMGVGYPHQIVEAVKRGVDMFDCVIPSREARHGRVYTFVQSDGLEVEARSVRNEQYRTNFTAINPSSRMLELQRATWAYLRHLFMVEEQLGQRLATLQNIETYLELVCRLRK